LKKYKTYDKLNRIGDLQMKIATGFLTNTTTPAGRAQGAAKNNPGDNTGTGADKETFNETYYGHVGVIESYKENGLSDADETTTDCDMRDAIEELVAKKVDGVADWASGTLYTTPDTLVMRYGFQFLAYNLTGNQAKEPLANPGYWYKSPQPEILLDMFFKGMPESFGLNGIANRAGANYAQSALIGNYRLGGNGDDFYNFFMVALDGTVVTGNAPLEAIFDVGGGNEYFNLDLIAPDNLGTRTLIDMSSRHLAPQSSGGDNDVLGEVLADRFQGHYHTFDRKEGLQADPGAGRDTFSDPTDSNDNVLAPITDGVNGTPRTGTTTRPKEFTVGSSYIIVMIPA
jgi:hypothetical protein